MEQFRVEKLKASVTLMVRGSGELPCHLFLVPGPSEEPTVSRIRELLNGFEAFLPLEVEGRTVVQSKERILWCRYEGPIGPVVEVLLPRRRVTLMLEDGSTLSGDLVADGPPDRRRVLDCLNRSEPFLLVETKEGDFVVRKDAIVLVPSAELGDPRREAEFELESPQPQLVETSA